MSEQPPPMGREPTEEELQAAYEAELQRIRVEDVVANTLVSLLNLGGRRAGLVPGTEQERDLGQVRMAIEGVRVLLPLIEAELGPQARQLRDALSQLQMAYAQLSGAGAGAAAGPGAEGPPPSEGEPPGAGGPESSEQAEPSRPGEPGPAQRSGRLWIPGQ